MTNTVQHQKKNLTTVTPAMRLVANAIFWANRTIFQFLILSFDWQMSVLKRSFCLVLSWRCTIPSFRPCLFSLCWFSCSPSPFLCCCRSLCPALSSGNFEEAWPGSEWAPRKINSNLPCSIVYLLKQIFCRLLALTPRAEALRSS